MVQESFPPILISSYCRPLLTLQAVKRILSDVPQAKLYVSHDGLVPNHFEIEHYKTRQILLSLSKNTPQLELNLRDENSGLMNHIMSVFEKILLKYNSLIFLEEDQLVQVQGLKFLAEVTYDKGISHRCAFSSTDHPLRSNQKSWRNTFFPEQWGISINREAFEAIKLEYQAKSVTSDVVRRVINLLEEPRIRRRALIDYWLVVLQNSINDPHSWDALFQLMLWRNLVPSHNSINNFVTDLGGGEGSITKRDRVIGAKNYQDHNLNKFNFCLRCEKLDAERRNISTLGAFRSRLRIRSRILNYFQNNL